MIRTWVLASACAVCVGCVEAALLPPEVALRDRLCDAVVASYKVGLRPSVVEVTIPGSNAGDPPLGLTFTGTQMPLAEQCLGLPVPRVAEVQNKPNAPAAPPAPSEPPSVPSTVPAATELPATPAPSALPSPRRPRTPNPLDTRT